MNKVFEIKNVKPFVLEDSNLAYKIEEGTASVYIAEFIDNRPMFRLFLKDLKPGDTVSGLNKIYDACQYKMFLVNSSKDYDEELAPLKVSTLQTTDEICNNFIKSIGILCLEETYQENIIQHYLLDKVKESRNVYSEYISNVNAKEETSKNIKKTLQNQKTIVDKSESYTSNLYFALAKICYYMRIKCVSYSKLNNNLRTNLTIDSFCKYSACTHREVKLDIDWYKKDVGNFIAYTKTDNSPVAVVYRKNSYYIISKDHPSPIRVNKNNATDFKENVYVIYSTFPARAINYKDIIRHIKNSIPLERLVSIAVFAGLLSLIGMILPLMTQLIYDKLIPNNDYEGVFGCACVLFAMIFGTAALSLVKGFSSFSLSSKIKYSLQIAFFDRVFKLKQSFIKNYEPANLSMITLGIGSIFTSLTTKTVASILSFIFGFFYLFQMFAFMPSLCFPALLVLLATFILLTIFARIQFKWNEESVNLNIEKSSLLFQIIRGIEKLRITGAEDRASNKYIDKFSKVGSLSYKVGYYSTLITIISTMFSSVLTIVFYSIIYADGLNASVGAITGFMSAYSIFSAAVLQIPGIYSSYLQAKPWLTKLKPICGEAPEKFLQGAAKDIDGTIDVKHLCFAYEKNGDNVLNDVSFKIERGQYVGIVGESGCGKTTLLNLLLGFEHPDKGKIFYSNHDLEELDMLELRQQFGVVLQDGDLIAGSIFDNITITNPKANLNEVNDVLDQVGLLDEVNKMPMGVHTILSEGSGMISGGQKQRILIARAIMSKPKILFLDEATSSLDNITQMHICENLDKIGCTRLVIAHRLSTIINCDKILVFENGRIVETGSYGSLMKQKGTFYKLAKRQIS